jgi:hypothetical protein
LRFLGKILKKLKFTAYRDKHTLKLFFFQILAKDLTEKLDSDMVKESNILFIHTCLEDGLTQNINDFKAVYQIKY